MRFRDTSGIVFNFPGLWRKRRGRGESLSREIQSSRQKSRRGLWPGQTFSRQEFAVVTETGSTVDGDGFRVWRRGFDSARGARTVLTRQLTRVGLSGWEAAERGARDLRNLAGASVALLSRCRFADRA
jgi:hypothetical protein